MLNRTATNYDEAKEIVDSLQNLSLDYTMERRCTQHIYLLGGACMEDTFKFKIRCAEDDYPKLRVVDGVVVGGIYKHFKGGVYKVLNIAVDTEDIYKKMVVYQNIKDEKLVWARPLEMFKELIEVDKKYIPRFELVGEENK